MRSDYTGALTGHRRPAPVVSTTGARFSVSVSRSSIGHLTAAKFIAFCKQLLHDAGGPMFLVLDGHPVHRSKAVSRFAESTGGVLTLFRIPAYSPHT